MYCRKTTMARVETRDSDIRRPLVAWLLAQHSDDPALGLIEEFKMPRPSARIDLAVVNGELVGFEIKSDADTLSRLTVQVPAFSRFFDRVSVVTTGKHVKETRRRIPNWWGIILYQGDKGFRVARRSKRNQQVDVRSLLYALSKTEIADLADRAGFAVSKTGKKRVMVDAVASDVAKHLICGHARDIIRQRHRDYEPPPVITS